MQVDLSSEYLPATFLHQHGGRHDPLVSREMGPVALSDPGKGLLYQLWTGVCENGAVSAVQADGTKTHLFSDHGITEISLTFDQNGHATVAYAAHGAFKLFWYDPSAGQFTTRDFGNGLKHPKATLDDKRSFASSYSDIVLAYKRNAQLCYRLQRENYDVEHVLLDAVDGPLYTVQMGSNLRLQFLIGRGRSDAILRYIPEEQTSLETSYRSVSVRKALGAMDDEYSGGYNVYEGLLVGDIARTFDDEYASMKTAYKGARVYSGVERVGNEHAGTEQTYVGVTAISGVAHYPGDEHAGSKSQYKQMEINQ